MSLLFSWGISNFSLPDLYLVITELILMEEQHILNKNIIIRSDLGCNISTIIDMCLKQVHAQKGGIQNLQVNSPSLIPSAKMCTPSS